MIGDPPLTPGAVQVTSTWESPRTPVTDVGAFGTVNGVTADDACEAELFPTMLVAMAVNV